MANAIVGSGIVLALASLMGIPVGIAAGVYLAEFGRGKLLASAVRFTADVLNGVPSIVMGIAIYSLIVMQQKHFSAFAGGVALAIMMVPTITRTTEEMLATVPHAIREAALGLGVPKWRTVLSVSLRTASPGIITGCMLAFARVAGETAPLLFTAFGNQFWSFKLTEPIAALPLQIYVYAHLALRRVAPAGLGRLAGADCDDHGVGDAGAHLSRAAACLKGGKLSGSRDRCRTPERVVRDDAHAAGHQPEDSGEPCDGADRALGLRQEHLRALPEPHARDQPDRARDGRGEDGRRRHLQGCAAGGDPAARRHGVPAAQPVSDDVDLRQRGERAEAERLSQPRRFWTRRWSAA